jgi:hypothetical protein
MHQPPRGREVERRARQKKEATMADRVGQQFGNYLLVTLLGQGGFAEVYLGWASTSGSAYKRRSRCCTRT